MATLDLQQTRCIRISARAHWSDTGITIVAGQRYQFEATGMWTDFFIKCDANGYRSENAPRLSRGMLKKHEPKRRLPGESWFVLAGALDRDEATAFPIGKSLSYTARRSGELSCFPNDERSFYWNNWGSIVLFVTRIG